MNFAFYLLKQYKLCVVLICCIALTSCFNNSKYSGYTKTETGLYYKILEIGDGESMPIQGNFLKLSIVYKTINDSTFYDTYSLNNSGKVILPYNNVSFKGSFEELINTMNEGDSYSYIVNADSLFQKFFKIPLPVFLQKGEMVKMDVKLYNIYTDDEYASVLEKENRVKNKNESIEQDKLNLFLDTTKTTYTKLNNGLYNVLLEKGTGDNVKIGDKVTIEFIGRFLNGTIFESSNKYALAFEYIYGQQDQVIKGINLGLKVMNLGSKAKFIIPSRLAFGEIGSANNSVQPFTTVIYEIKLLKLNNK